MPVISPPEGTRIATLRLPVIPASAARARAFVREMARDHGFDADTLYDFDVCVGEAVTNAIEHGSASAARGAHGEVEVRAYTHGEGFVIEVRDHGEGFDPRTARRAEMGDGIAERGRGLSIIRALMDDLALTRTESGMAVRMTRRLPADA